MWIGTSVYFYLKSTIWFIRRWFVTYPVNQLPKGAKHNEKKNNLRRNKLDLYFSFLLIKSFQSISKLIYRSRSFGKSSFEIPLGKFQELNNALRMANFEINFKELGTVVVLVGDHPHLTRYISISILFFSDLYSNIFLLKYIVAP